MIINRGHLDRISRITQVDEADPFDDSTILHVETWDDTFGQHVGLRDVPGETEHDVAPRDCPTADSLCLSENGKRGSIVQLAVIQRFSDNGAFYTGAKRAQCLQVLYASDPAGGDDGKRRTFDDLP